MKRAFLFLLLASFLLPCPAAISAPEEYQEPPIPKFTAAQVIEMVSKYYEKHKAEYRDAGFRKGAPDMFIISVIYGRPDQMRADLVNDSVFDGEKEWSWFVRFSNPREMDATIVFRLKNNGEIAPLMHTSS